MQLDRNWHSQRRTKLLICYFLHFGLRDGILALENGDCVEFVDVFILVSWGEGLHCGFNCLLLSIGMISGEDQARCSSHLQIGGILGFLGVGLDQQQHNK